MGVDGGCGSGKFGCARSGAGGDGGKSGVIVASLRLHIHLKSDVAP